MLSQYAKEHGFSNCEFFVDDGYSGTNFNRPDFQRMLGLVEEGMVAVICVKDLSRLGRDYLQTGYYTEVVFPENHTRFIAINDNVDSEKGDNEFAPFKNIINEWYAKDCSRKVRSAFRTKALSGEYTGGYPAYGYCKDPNDRHHLIPDKHAPHCATDVPHGFRRCYYELQTLLDTYSKQTDDIRRFAKLVEAYTDITEVTEELLHTLVDKIVVHEKEVVDSEIIMRVDIYYRFIGKVGDAEGEALKAPKIRRNTKLFMEAGIISEV